MKPMKRLVEIVSVILHTEAFTNVGRFPRIPAVLAAGLCAIGISVPAMAAVAPAVAGVQAPALSGDALVQALRKGGYVIVMRHAASPRTVPDKQTANPDNTNLERQLDAEGRATAAAMGQALRDLRIPVGEVDSSPTYRARETVRMAKWPAPKIEQELGDGGRGMQAAAETQGDWLKKRVGVAPARGTNTINVTHFPNISRAFPESSSGLADGESIVFAPDGKGGAAVVARVKIEDWPNMARDSAR